MAKNEAPTEETLDELRAKYGTILECDAEDVHVVLAKPMNGGVGPAYKRFKEQLSNDRTRISAFEGLFHVCVVYPERDEVKNLLEDEPALAFTFGKEAAELLGLRDANVKKS
jgi:hypothetical protein